MVDKNENDSEYYSSLFDSISHELKQNNISAKAISDMIKSLETARDEAQKREEEEKRRLKEEKEKRKREEKERKEQEHVEEVTSMDLPLTWENAFARADRTVGVYAESTGDGLWLSLENLGRVDMEYIAERTGSPVRDVIEALRGSVYQTPDTWEE